MASDEEGDEHGLCMLGFAEEPECPTDLLRHRFPSKAGGRPAWLDPVHLPTRSQLACAAGDGAHGLFLLQVYCPRDENPDQGFHRTIFLFVSKRGDQLHEPGAVKALRCQLPRDNPYYGFHPAPQDQRLPRLLQAQQRSLSVSRDPWQVAVAEEQAPAAVDTEGCPALLGPELELVVEPEPEDGADEATHPGVARVLADYQARVAVEGDYDEQELPASLVDELEEGQGPDRAAFAAFQARTARAPDQVLRYCGSDPGDGPLWLTTRCTPAAADIPPCPHCGAARTFEFQVMPQLLNFLHVDASDPHALDWGTIVVYTCPASCSVPPQAEAEGPGTSTYVEEFVWVQPS